MGDRYFEVVVTRTITGTIKVSDDMLLSSEEDPEEVACELAGMDDGWEHGTRYEEVDSVEALEITAARAP